MEALFTYLVKVNTALFLFWIFYRLLFGKDTFFELKRVCLWSVLVLSFVYPLANLSFLLAEDRPVALIRYVANFQMELTEGVVVVGEPLPAVFDWGNLLWTAYAAGIAFLLFRMAVQVAGICRFAFKGCRQFLLNTNIISPGRGVAPFSFLGWIFVNPEEYTLRELQEIVTHEKVHVRQGHSADMLISELVCVFCWFNPAAWLLRREIRQNLEFLADKDVVSSGFNRKNYQYHLLRLSHQPGAAPIVNNFTVSQLKKRIVMMNKKRSSKISLAKYLSLLPVTVCLVLAVNVHALADSVAWPVEKTGDKNVTISGKVTDDKGKELPGVNVVVKGTYTGSVTGPKGEFTLKVPEGATLAFSYVGRKTVEVKNVTGQQAVQVRMEPETVQMETVEVRKTQEGTYITTGKGMKVVASPVQVQKSDEEVFVVVEEMPRFQAEGGVPAYIAGKLVYPKEAVEKKIEGKVYVKFTVTASGKVADPSVIRSVDPLLDKEALRVIREMPDWVPGKQRGQAVDVSYTLPVEFRLKQERKEGSGGVFEVIQNLSDQEDVRQVIINTKSVDGKNKPLVIIDGYESNEDLQKLNPEGIKSITVLKDSASTVLYGVKGKNGVIVIEREKK